VLHTYVFPSLPQEKRRGKVFSREILTIGLDYLRDGARYSMYRRLLQRNAILNAADHMSAVDAITIHNFKLRLAYYRCALIAPFSMCLLPFFCVHLSPTSIRCLFTYCIIGTIGTRHYTVHLRTIYGLEPWIRFGTIFFMRSSLRKGMVSSWLW
jgi:hypothetical protein